MYLFFEVSLFSFLLNAVASIILLKCKADLITPLLVIICCLPISFQAVVITVTYKLHNKFGFVLFLLIMTSSFILLPLIHSLVLP